MRSISLADEAIEAGILNFTSDSDSQNESVRHLKISFQKEFFASNSKLEERSWLFAGMFAFVMSREC
jgi:hypothetical protein